MKKALSTILRALCCSVVLLAPSVVALAEERESGDRWYAPAGDRSWLQNYDPTLFKRRLFSEFTYEDHDQDGDFYKVETSIRAALPVRENLALGLQVMLPMKWDETAVSDDAGLGDVEFRAGLIGRISSTVRYGVGVNTVIESASDSALSSNAFILRPITALRWDASERLNVGINVEYNFTPVEEGADDASALELKFPVAYKISDDWSAALTYKPRWNFVSDSDRNRLELSATFQWGSDHQYAVSFGGECPLSEEALEYKLLTSFAWYF